MVFFYAGQFFQIRSIGFRHFHFSKELGIVIVQNFITHPACFMTQCGGQEAFSDSSTAGDYDVFLSLNKTTVSKAQDLVLINTIVVEV